MNKIRISCYEHDIERANETIALQADLLLEECKKVDYYREELEEEKKKREEIELELKELKNMISGTRLYRVREILKRMDTIIEKC
jgi:hypothetical protein